MSNLELSLKLEEANELKFKMNIQGTTSEPGMEKPKVRLLLTMTEDTDSFGLVFPATSTEGDTITFSVPALVGIAMADKPYYGQVEVLIGTRIFTPVTMEIKFKQAIKIEVSPLKEENPFDLNELILSETASQPGQPGAPKKISITKSQLEKLIKEKASEKNTSASKTKQTFKEMFKSALTDDES